MASLVEKLKKIPLKADSHKLLPESAGIYIFFRDNLPIYIGKAINLKRRVSSYFDLDLNFKTKRMVAEANFLSFIQVNSELESLLLEAKLIRKYMPHYNVAAKDDKHPLYIVITKEKYPRVLSARKLIANGYRVKDNYGPFPSSTSVHSVLRMLRRIFPFSDHKIARRACLYSHIGLCNPCPNVIRSESDTKIYLKNIRRIKSILSAKFDGVKRDLEREMKEFSKIQKYEEARLIREQIGRLDYITRPQMPVDSYLENPNLYGDQRKLEIRELKKLIRNYNVQIRKLHRIECYDVSHLTGVNATASMVTFIDGEAEKNYYRHFKIRKAKAGDDYDAMREVAKRRVKHFEDWGKPDLIVVDGGKGQVSSFLIDVPVIGIAKQPDRLIVGENKIKLTGPSLNLVSRMRDEAHRFARRYHHHLISKVYKNADAA